jgi:hypothetical protein
MKKSELRQIIKEEIKSALKENNSRAELHRILKGILIASRSSAFDAKEREKKLEKELENFMKQHPEFTEEEVERIQDRIADRL